MTIYELDITGYVPLNKCNKHLVNPDTGKIIHATTKRISSAISNRGYAKITLDKKTYSIHRLIYEQFNGPIPENYDIDHIDDNKINNKLSNLQALTRADNVKKSAKNRNYDFVGKTHENRKNVLATNTDTGEIRHYNSLYRTSKELGINAGIIKFCAENKLNVKSGISKIDNSRWKFQYE